MRISFFAKSKIKTLMATHLLIVGSKVLSSSLIYSGVLSVLQNGAVTVRSADTYPIPLYLKLSSQNCLYISVFVYYTLKERFKLQYYLYRMSLRHIVIKLPKVKIESVLSHTNESL